VNLTKKAGTLKVVRLFARSPPDPQLVEHFVAQLLSQIKLEIVFY
jgi:hypothetical protein